MKTYQQTIDGSKYRYFFDRRILSWTIYKIDEKGNQISQAEYYANKSSLLNNYKLKFDEN